MRAKNHDPARPQLSIIIVSYNTSEITEECLRRVTAHSTGIDLEILVVDNASTDGSPEMVRREFPEVKLIVSKNNLGFAGGNNLGIQRARGRYLLLLNSDAYLLPGVLATTLSFMDKTPDCGVLGVKLIGEDSEMQPCARKLPTPWLKLLVISGIAAKFPKSRFWGGADHSWWDHDAPREVGWVPGAYFLVRREVVAAIGGMDERYFLYFEETDYCLQAMRAGWRVMIFPEVSVIHLGGESSKTENQAMTVKGKQILEYNFQSEYKYYRKNYGRLWVLAAAGVEVAWNLVVIMKNVVFRGPGSPRKIRNSRLLIGLMFQALGRSRWGR
jgi:GT2 family glycosyltransferase